MKKTFLLLFILLFSGVVYSQIPDYSKLESIVKQPPGYISSPLGTNSTIVTVNGFDNFYLGTDFGEPYIATNPNDPLNSICAFNTNNIYYTIDGVNWIKTYASFPGFAVIGDPVVTYDSLGNAYYVQLYQNGSTYGLAVSRSNDKGVTWSMTSGVYGTTVGLCDKEWITADLSGGPYSNNVYIAWRQFGSTNMRFVRSTNLGQNWSPPVIDTLFGDQGAYVAVGPNGNIPGGCVYLACIYGAYISIFVSTDGGASFGPQMFATPYIAGPGINCYGRNTVKGCIRTDYMPRMAVDNSWNSTRGNVYIVYAYHPSGIDLCDILLVRSTNNGVNWSTPVRVNDDNTNTDQWMPSISVDKNGKVFVCWYDSRVDSVNNLQTRLYGTTSTNGGVSFTQNFNISNADFNPDNMKVSQGSGQAYYIGDYIGISSTNNVGYAVWMDGRNNNLGSYTAYYPDFAMTSSANTGSLNNNDSAFYYISVPAIKGPYSGRVKFTASLDTLPASGTLTLSFVNGKDSVTTFPDSVRLRVKASANVTSRLYKINVFGRGLNGTPAHLRTISLAVNSSFLSVGTNRNSICNFKVNGNTYNTTQQFVFPNNSNVTVQAISPQSVGATNYVYTNWSNSGDTTQTILINGPLNLTAYYKAQYKLTIISSQGTTFGGNIFYDSGAAFQFGVTSRKVVNGGITYYFRGWTGAGQNSYTSTDSTGLDSAVTFSMKNAIVEFARWTTWPNSINQIGNDIPLVYNLYQNYPNPFNPSTTMKYDIIKNVDVKIVIYDILGKEMNIVVNSKHSPGRYEVVFNSENLASGIYYYKITAGDFAAIKKMIIIK